ncbi:fimbrillin family protein [Phocaeicola coprophilus]|nr:fimbrillin family protein [Phocaeicola coprophilus]
MKRKCILGLAGLMVLGACTNDEVIDVKQTGSIDLRPLIENSTRATATTVANLGSFKVDVLKGTETYGAMTVTGSDNGTKWTTSPLTYWPSNASQQLDFYAYAPTSTEGVTINGTDKKITSYTPSTTVADQKDLVIAYNTGTKTANEASGVPLLFKHALSQIEVKAKCANANMKVEIIGVKVVSVAKDGTFTFPTATTQSGQGKELARTLWAPGSEKIAYMVKNSAPVELTKTAQSLMPSTSGTFMLIPQAITPWNKQNNATTAGSYISVLCRISNVSGDNETLIFPTTAGKYGFSAVAIGTTDNDKTWEPGKKYIYTLEFFGTDSGGGRFDPDPTVPDGGGGDTDVDTTDPKDGGKEILKPITFTVDVEDWTEMPVDLNM